MSGGFLGLIIESGAGDDHSDDWIGGDEMATSNLRHTCELKSEPEGLVYGYISDLGNGSSSEVSRLWSNSDDDLPAIDSRMSAAREQQSTGCPME